MSKREENLSVKRKKEVSAYNEDLTTQSCVYPNMSLDHAFIRRKREKLSNRRSMKCESGAANYADMLSNVNDGKYDVIDDDSISDVPFIPSADRDDISTNPQLYWDMENLIFIYGEKSVQYELFEHIDEIKVELRISSDIQNGTTEVNTTLKSEPLIVTLHLSLSRYLDSPEWPKVEVFKQSKKDGFRVDCYQVRKFLENYLSSEWHHLHQDYQKCLQAQNNLTADVISELPSDEAVEELVNLGFEADLARNALIITHGSISEAASLILDNPNVIKKESDHPVILDKLKRLLPTSSRIPVHHVKCMHSDLDVKTMSLLDGKNAKVVPSIAEGLLVQIFRYVKQRIPTINEYCVVCDEPNILQICTMYTPVVCSKELCVFAFGCLGVMADAAEEIAARPEVADLLIKLIRAASKSGRRKIIFDPFPFVIDPEDSHNLLLTPMKPDYHLAETLIDAIPPMKEMSLMESLQKKLDASYPLAYPLIQWILTSNRSHIVKLPSEKQLDFMQTPHQFLLRQSSPAKEAAFQKAKSKYGSSFAFHGSGIENWHSIIRQGLIKASGTRLQMNGAASGKGIYLSPEFAISMGYSRMGYRRYTSNVNKTESDGKSQFLDSSDITCIALCEVINTPLKKFQSTWLCPEPNNVCMRFLFVYEYGQAGDMLVNTQNAMYLLPIYKALGFDAFK